MTVIILTGVLFEIQRARRAQERHDRRIDVQQSLFRCCPECGRDPIVAFCSTCGWSE